MRCQYVLDLSLHICPDPCLTIPTPNGIGTRIVSSYKSDTHTLLVRMLCYSESDILRTRAVRGIHSAHCIIAISNEDNLFYRVIDDELVAHEIVVNLSEVSAGNLRMTLPILARHA